MVPAASLLDWMKTVLLVPIAQTSYIVQIVPPIISHEIPDFMGPLYFT